MMMATAQTNNIIDVPFGGSVVKIGSSWLPFFDAEPMKSQLDSLSRFLENETRNHNMVFPLPEKVFTWTWACSFYDVKVVILGQDPYSRAQADNSPLAHGLAFSVLPGTPIPRSLENIFKELKYEYPEFQKPNHGCLMSWATQGVLLLNTCLTVQAYKQGSHLNKGWEAFTDAVLSLLIKQNDGLVFILWGNKAQMKIDLINKVQKAKADEAADTHATKILTGTHPSPQGANFGGFFSKEKNADGQLVCYPHLEYFKRCNEILTMQGKSEINWTELPLV